MRQSDFRTGPARAWSACRTPGWRSGQEMLGLEAKSTCRQRTDCRLTRSTAPVLTRQPAISFEFDIGIFREWAGLSVSKGQEQ
jgi:hypothetical protein